MHSFRIRPKAHADRVHMNVAIDAEQSDDYLRVSETFHSSLNCKAQDTNIGWRPRVQQMSRESNKYGLRPTMPHASAPALLASIQWLCVLLLLEVGSTQKVTPWTLQREEIPLPRDHIQLRWLDPSIKGVQEYTDMYGPGLVADPTAASAPYYAMSSTVHAQVRQATDELHEMFIEATKYGKYSFQASKTLCVAK
jgi:hypothetical protein